MHVNFQYSTEPCRVSKNFGNFATETLHALTTTITFSNEERALIEKLGLQNEFIVDTVLANEDKEHHKFWEKYPDMRDPNETKYELHVKYTLKYFLERGTIKVHRDTLLNAQSAAEFIKQKLQGIKARMNLGTPTDESLEI